MSTLRVLLSAAPEVGRADAWALFDANDSLLQSGRDTPADWPDADSQEAVLAASTLRIVGLRLPPMPADRVAAAASYALEDQVAGPAEEQHIAVSPQSSDGSVEAIITSRELVASLAASFDRVLAEPALAPRPNEGRWHWYASAAGGGFVRRPDGSAFATGDQEGVPVELTLALDHAIRAGRGPGEVAVALPTDTAMQAVFARQAETTFVSIAPWRWDAAGSADFANASDLLQGEFARATPNAGRRPIRELSVAALVAATAISLHIIASIGQWAILRVEDWRANSALASLARDMGGMAGAGESVGSVGSVGISGGGASGHPAGAIARRYADERHRAGMNAPSDALPLLALAAPALAALPAGMLRTATYADGHWTFDLAKPDGNTVARVEKQLASAGLNTLQATNASGARLRVSRAMDTR
jgi:hypothetical protein